MDDKELHSHLNAIIRRLEVLEGIASPVGGCMGDPEAVEPFELERTRRKVDGMEVDVRCLLERDRVWVDKFGKIAERLAELKELVDVYKI